MTNTLDIIIKTITWPINFYGDLLVQHPIITIFFTFGLMFEVRYVIKNKHFFTPKMLNKLLDRLSKEKIEDEEKKKDE